MNDSEERSDSETSSIASVEEIPENSIENEQVENLEESSYINNVRNNIREWKLREMDANTSETSEANGLQGLRGYVAKTAQLFYDLQNYLQTSKNNEKNMSDALYVSIIDAIGLPGTLNHQLKMLIEHYLQRDLVELPFTVEPKVINTYAKKGMEMQTEFPDEE